MAKTKRIAVSSRSDLQFYAILLISGVVLLSVVSVARSFPRTWQLEHEVFHAVMETLGCMMALGIVGFLLMRQGEKGNEYKLWLACAMLSMAILDAFHASVALSPESVCLYSTAQFVGGVFIALIWVPERFAKTQIARQLPKVIAAVCGLFGVISLLFPEVLPSMANSGRFAFVPQLLNLAGTVLFLAGLVYFARRFCREHDRSHLLFTTYCLMFAAAGVTFRLSELCGVGWWLSHLIRLGAYVVAFRHVSVSSSADYQLLIETEDALRKAHDDLEVRVEQRTAELKRANLVLEAEITERQKAEHALDNLNRDLESMVLELRRMNKELQEFAYIAAHDLKTPLRGICTLADWLSMDYSHKFDEEGKERVRLLATRAKKMGGLIDSILQYSELGRSDPKHRQVDMNVVLSEVIDGIAPPENIEIRAENELPVITCEKAQITQILQNLLSNAVKYMDKPKGEIKVGCLEQDGSWRFSVADNGPGIDGKYFKKIFKIFQTLAPRGEAGSIGIGLSIVKKIAEMNGGKVWVESQRGKGSTFFFTLPRRMRLGHTERLQAHLSPED